MAVGLQNFFRCKSAYFFPVIFLYIYIHNMLNSRLYNRESYALVEIYVTGKAS